MGSFRDFFLGKKEKQEKLSFLNPQQEQRMSEYFSGQKGIGQNPTYQMGNQLIMDMMSGQDQGMAALQAPAMRQFQEQIIPMIMERFQGMGSGHSGSTAEDLMLGSAGAGLQEKLAAMMMERQMEALGMALPYAQAPGAEDRNLMNMRTFENTYQSRQPGFLENASLAGIGSIGGILSGIGSMRQGKAMGDIGQFGRQFGGHSMAGGY